MKILAVNTAGTNTEIGLIDGGKRTFYRDACGRRASVALMPAVEALLNKAGLAVSDLDALAVVVGPGSFTGIRIGVSTVRALAYARDLPVICVNLCEVLAYNRGSGTPTVTVSDAGNGFCYVARFDEALRPLDPPACLTVADAERYVADHSDFTVATDAVMQRLGSMGEREGLLDAVWAHRDETVPYEQVVPLYIRKSQAEELCK